MPSTKLVGRAIGTATMAAIAAAAAVGALSGVAGPASSQEAGAFLDLRRQQRITGDANAGKPLSQVCSACHGPLGHGIGPTFPDLAGQSATYLYVQLKSIKGGQRDNPVMAPFVAPLDDTAMRNLAAYFASLPPKPTATALAGSPAGEALFRDGDPARGIPPCQGCHGPDGGGPRSSADVDAEAPRPPWTTIPRLRGQSATYLAKALRDFRSGARANTSNAQIMQGVAKTLDEADIQSLADYLAAQ